MRKIYKRFSVITSFAVLLAVLLVNTAVTRRQLAVENRNQDWVQHTQDVELELTTTESLLKDAETGQRGYLYTGQAGYLAPYEAARGQVEAHLNRLAGLVADNPAQNARLPQLRELCRQKLDELERTIELFKAGKKDEARALVTSNVGRHYMEEIRSLIGAMQQDELALEKSRLELVDSSSRALVGTIYLTTALAVAGLVLLAFFILRAMSEREKHAAELREREEWFRVTLGSIGDAVIATDEKGHVTFVNPIAEQITGVSLKEARGREIQRIFPIFNEQTHVPVENPVAKVLEQGRIMGLANHTVLQRADGSVIPIEDSAAPIYDDRKKLRGVVMVFRDVTEDKLAQDLLRKAEKLAAAGRLAATVAHEINNPLEAVGNLIYLVRQRADLPDEAQNYLRSAEQELDRVSQITRQTLGFYRDSTIPASVDVCAVVEAAVKTYEHKLKSKNITMELALANCPPIEGLQGELKQLMANLISNAADAVASGGKIRISVRPAGDHGGVEIKVADNGPGVAQADLVRIFEPFYTTKQDVGTGLGLWVSRGIVERHGGSIEVASGRSNGNELGGALFTVTITGVDHGAAMTGAA
jgi:PAS domain S-box-containing protein